MEINQGTFYTRYLGQSCIYFCLVYALINIIYSLGVKHIPVLDILFVSSGFLIRIFLGGYAINVPISWWLASLIFLMAIYILIAKRKDDDDGAAIGVAITDDEGNSSLLYSS